MQGQQFGEHLDFMSLGTRGSQGGLSAHVAQGLEWGGGLFGDLRVRISFVGCITSGEDLALGFANWPDCWVRVGDPAGIQL